ncbi:MAG: hypothetical protein ABIS50_23065 [Luteolibacter sp.]|uniref:hypothetical protein n=1 Tax=Luteolibacter sp. TaxID=1962973 RepID=UPI0032661F02
MPFIAFLGCDGSGKSAVIEEVTRRLMESGESVRFGHWRPKPFATGETPAAGADDPHGAHPRGAVASVAKLGWLWLNWWVAWFQQLRRDGRDGFLLFDRYHADLLVDPRRYRYGGPMSLARFASHWMPQPDRVIFLDAPADVLLSRKQEVGRESLDHSRASYLALCLTHPRFRVIDATPALHEVVERVMKAIRPD